MKLVVATPLYPPEPGGPATYAALLAAELPGRGIDVSLARFSAVRRYPKVIRHIAYFFMLLAKGRNADAILALDPVSTGLPAALAARVLGKTFFVKIVGDYAWEQGVQRFNVQVGLDDFSRTSHVPIPVGMLRDIERWVALRAKKILVPSEYLKRIVASWPLPSERIEVVHNAVSIQDIGKVPDAISALPRPLVVSVGRLVPWKGMKGLIDAMESVRETLPASLAIIGSGPEQEHLSSWAHKKLGASAVLAGTLSHEDTLAALKGADALVLNTSYEGLSHLLIEALALGVPIITTPVGGNTELIWHGKNGILVPQGDSAALVEAIQAVLVDAPLRERLSKAAKESAERFSVERLTEKTSALLKACV